MNALITILLYFAIGSIAIFIIGIGIQFLQSRKNESPNETQQRKRKSQRYARSAE